MYRYGLMMQNLGLVSDLAPLADVDHSLALVVVSTAARTSHALAAVHVPSGDVLAADGWYYDSGLPATPALHPGLWDEWDDMPSKLLWRHNMPWYEHNFAYLSPHYSPAHAVAELLLHWAHQPAKPPVADAELVAYFPVADQGSVVEYLKTAQSLESERLGEEPGWRGGPASRLANAQRGLDLIV